MSCTIFRTTVCRQFLVSAGVIAALALNGCGPEGQGTALVSPEQESNVPPIPPGLRGKAAVRAAAPDGRPHDAPSKPGS
jgi:hypothetical protein